MDALHAQRRLLPRALGRYEVIGTLARGGMGNVYLGRHAGEAGFQRVYAIKVMHEHLAADEEFVRMLLDEARIAARLHHPNVVAVADQGSQDGLHYVVMEYVEGAAFSDLLRKHPRSRPPRVIVPIILDVLSGLHAAHTLLDDDGNAMNLIHRDVSPQNILVGLDGTARITDFGIAKAESRIASTHPGHLKGKVHFMSPEQVRDADDVDRRSDIFSLGIVLWTALTGVSLFEAPTDAAVMNNVLAKRIVPPSQVGLRPPPALDAICMRALERDPRLRPATALEMEEALRATAAAHGFLGTKREISEWVSAVCGEELAERRKGLRPAKSARPAAEESARPALVESDGVVRADSRSVITPVAPAPPSGSEVITVPPPPNYDHLTEESKGGIAAPPHSSPQEATAARTGPRVWLVPLILIGLLGAGAGAWLALRSPHPAPSTPSSQIAPPPASGAAAPAPSPLAAAPPPSPAPLPANSAPAPAPQAAPPDAAPAPPARAPWPTPRAPVARPRPAGAPSPPAPGPAPTPPPATEPKRPAHWDIDSPLPP